MYCKTCDQHIPDDEIDAHYLQHESERTDHLRGKMGVVGGILRSDTGDPETVGSRGDLLALETLERYASKVRAAYEKARSSRSASKPAREMTDEELERAARAFVLEESGVIPPGACDDEESFARWQNAVAVVFRRWYSSNPWKTAFMDAPDLRLEASPRTFVAPDGTLVVDELFDVPAALLGDA